MAAGRGVRETEENERQARQSVTRKAQNTGRLKHKGLSYCKAQLQTLFSNICDHI